MDDQGPYRESTDLSREQLEQGLAHEREKHRWTKRHCIVLVFVMIIMAFSAIKEYHRANHLESRVDDLQEQLSLKEFYLTSCYRQRTMDAPSALDALMDDLGNEVMEIRRLTRRISEERHALTPPRVE